MRKFEVELRSLLSEKQFKSLTKKFSAHTKGKKNDMATWAFLTNDVNIKIKNQITKKNAKMVLKNGAEYRQHVNEFELPININDVDKAIDFLKALGFKKYIPSFQKRTDYQIGKFTVSLKHETHWGYQIEVELLVKNKKEVAQAKEKIRLFLKDLGLTPLTEAETKALTNKTLKKFHIKQL